jgi:hypothetical protein
MSPIATPPPLPNVPPSPISGEPVKLVLDNLQQKTGMFSKQSWRMIVTDSRLIFAQQVKNYVDYLRQNPDASLAENPTNFSVSLDDVIVIEIYHGDFESNSPDSMEIKTNSGKMSFQIKDAYRATQNLKPVLGNKVK